MQKPNYQKMLESIIAAIPEGEAPKLLLHSCCAPCSSYCLEYLAQYFRITLLYYNPNISPEEEFRKRVEELRRLVRELPMKHPAEVVVPEYRPEEFYSAVKGMESRRAASAASCATACGWRGRRSTRRSTASTTSALRCR